MFTHALLLTVVLAADVAGAPFDNPRELRAAVRDTLRREATTQGAKHDQSVRDLTELFQQLKQDQQLPEPERRQRLGQIRHRLKDVADLLERHTGAKAAGNVAQRGDVLGQMMPALGGAGAANVAAGQARGTPAGTIPGEVEGAERLIELIQNTIAPDTWDVRGGPGTMMYFPPAKVLVIRQTGEVHGQVRDLSDKLRRQ